MSSEEEGSGSVPRVLARNSACHQCRKRKLKCDATKPTCTNCQRHNNRQANASKPKVLECTWDAPRRERRRYDDLEDPNSTAKRAKMAELEGKIADYERVLGQRDLSRSIAPRGISPHRNGATKLLSTTPGEDDWARKAGPSSMGNDEIPWERTLELPLVWPKWPIDLPSLEVIEHVVGVFFERVPLIPKMLHKSTFKANLQLPPTHWKFPARSLLHSILAITANHLPVEDLATKRYFPTGTPSSSIYHPEHDFETPKVQDRTFPLGAFHTAEAPVSASSAFARFQLWHRRKTMSSMSHHLDRGEKFLECIQAQVITTTVDQYNAWWTDLWMMSGSAMRLAIPTRLNESSKLPMDGLMTGAHVIMEPARDALEQACRDRTWWMVYLLERSVTLSTCWSPSLPDAEITAELPVLQTTFDRGWGDLDGVQNFHSPDFYSYHPDRHMDSLVFYIKAIRLVTEMNSFFRAYSRTAHSVSKYTNDVRVHLLLSQINSFRLSFPPKFRRPTQDLGEGAPDVEALAAIMMTHVMTIMLGEPLITKDTWRTDLARMSLTAIRASLSLLYDITATSFDLTLLPHVCAFCWGVASGALCRFIVAASETGDTVSVSVFRSEVQVFRMALAQYAERYPVGQRQIKMLDETLESTTAGLTPADNFNCGGKELIKELLDPDYIPGSLKSVPQGSIETITNVLASSSSSSPRTSSRGLPVTPDTHFMEQAKLRGRAHSLRTSATDCSSLPLDPGLPLPLSSFDEAVEDVATSLNGPHPGPSNHSNRSNEFKIPYAQNQVQNEPNEVNYDFMAMAMNMNTSLEGEMDFGSGNDTGGDFGFGFDINNFSFDMGDFTALLGQQGQGQAQGQGQEWDGRAGGSGQYGA